LSKTGECTGKEVGREEERKKGRGPTNLTRHAEDVGIVLNEPPHSAETAQRPARLVSVEDTKLGEPDGEFLERPRARVKDEAVAGAVHRLEGELVLVDREEEHVVLVIVVVPRCLPEVDVEHVGGDD
jgi:hypothetical protein